MQHFILGNIVDEISERENSPSNSIYDRFVGLEHYTTGKVEIEKYGETSNLNSAMKIFHTGDILVARRNVYLRRASVVYFDGLTSGDSIVLRPKDECIGRILPFILNTSNFWNYADQHSDGTMSKRLSPKILKQYEFDLPDEGLEELADLLWSIVDTKKSYEELLVKTDELVKSQFIEEFKHIDKDDYKSLKELCTLITDGTHNPPKFVDEGIPFLLVSNITDNVITYETPKYITEETYEQLMKRTPIEQGDVLLSTVGSYGHPAIVDSDRKFSFQRHIAHLKPDRTKLLSRYLHAAVLSIDVQEQIDMLVLGVAQKTLNLSKIKSIRIPVPTLDEQRTFISFVEQSDKSKFVFQISIYRALWQSGRKSLWICNEYCRRCNKRYHFWAVLKRISWDFKRRR